MKKITSIFATFILSTLIVSGCGSTSSDSETGSEGGESSESSNISIGTHPSGTAYNTAGSGISSVVSENSSMKVSVKTFSGPDSWMTMMNEGDLELGIISSVDANWALNGEGGFEENENVRLLVSGNKMEIAGFGVKEDSDIESLKDIKGKKVTSTFSGNQLTQKYLEAQLKSVGLTWDDVQQVPVTTATEGLKALRENRVDAAFVGTPTGAQNLETDAAVGLRIFNWAGVEPKEFDTLSEDVLTEIQDILPGTTLAPYKGGFLEEEKTILELTTVLLASNHLSEDGAYEVVKTLFEHYEELAPVHAWLEQWTPERMIVSEFSVPYHPGAIRYFEEEGLWTEEHEERQQELLGQ